MTGMDYVIVVAVALLIVGALAFYVGVRLQDAKTAKGVANTEKRIREEAAAEVEKAQQGVEQRLLAEFQKGQLNGLGKISDEPMSMHDLPPGVYGFWKEERLSELPGFIWIMQDPQGNHLVRLMKESYPGKGDVGESSKWFGVDEKRGVRVGMLKIAAPAANDPLPPRAPASRSLPARRVFDDELITAEAAATR